MTVVSPPLVDADSTREWGATLGRMLRAGDLVILTGGLGAGKTTLTQGIAAGLDVRGPITSPTFVIARIHPALSGGPVLVHVDAYRLGGLDELDDLDLDADLDRAVTIVEWGHGMAEGLSEDRLEIVLEGDATRVATVHAHGARWVAADLAALAAPGDQGGVIGGPDPTGGTAAAETTPSSGAAPTVADRSVER